MPAALPMSFVLVLGVEMSRLVMDEDEEKGTGEETAGGTGTGAAGLGVTRGRLKDGFKAIATYIIGV